MCSVSIYLRVGFAISSREYMSHNPRLWNNPNRLSELNESNQALLNPWKRFISLWEVPMMDRKSSSSLAQHDLLHDAQFQILHEW
mmetsp:Transcript_17491/g.36330  ORF Transcript_17491/g.36330 Transcript_17491/m.36330 type:complete len:85 (+) Transcript_17491:146-400(+)